MGSPATSQSFMDQLQALIDAYDSSEADGTFYSPEAIRECVPLTLQDDPLSQDELLDILKAIVIRTPKTANRIFFNQLFGGKEDLAVLADMMVARMNNSMYTYKVAGPHVLIEHELLRKACEIIGFADGEGTFCPGGSMGNLVAMILARHATNPDIRDHGLAANTYVAYTSTQGHYSIKKNAGVLGIGRKNVREIAVNSRGEMLVDEFSQQLRKDLAAGFTPFFVNLTAGTTVLGAFDDVTAFSAVAKAHKLWLHVDGSYGASVLMSRKRAALLPDISLADSVCWNPHKMMGVPLTCSMLLCKTRGLLAENFAEVSDYLFQEETDELNPGTKSLQCGRRNDGFKLWALWKQLGNLGFEKRLEEQFLLRDELVAMINADAAFELILEPALLNVCFKYRGVASDAICSTLDKRGLGKIGHGTFNSQHFIRMVVVNPELGPDDLADFLGRIKMVALDIQAST